MKQTPFLASYAPVVSDLKPEQWERMKEENNWNEIEVRDNRYNQVLHLVSAASGAEAFYCTENHQTRYEGLQVAKQLDKLTSQVRPPVCGEEPACQ